MTSQINSAANPATQRVSERLPLYSPTQAAVGTLGGPVGLIYFLRSNFLALGDERLARNTLLWGIVSIAALIAITPFLPEKSPSSLFGIVYIVIARTIAEKYQLTKEAIASSETYRFHSNWRVFLLIFPCLIASFAVIAIPLILLMVFGIWSP